MVGSGNPPAVRAGHNRMRYGQGGVMAQGASAPCVFFSLGSVFIAPAYFFTYFSDIFLFYPLETGKDLVYNSPVYVQRREPK